MQHTCRACGPAGALAPKSTTGDRSPEAPSFTAALHCSKNSALKLSHISTTACQTAHTAPASVLKLQSQELPDSTLQSD